jgi:hypothetical protein
MSSRQRIEAAFAHREPDRTPIFEYVLLSPIADRFLGRPYAGDFSHWGTLVAEMGFESAVRRMAVDVAELALRLGHDMLYVLPNPTPGWVDAGVESGVSPFDPFADDAVETLRRRNDREEESPSLPPEERFLIYPALREELARRGLDLPLLAPAYEHGIWTDVALMQTLLLDPDEARRHFALATRRSLAWTERYLEHGIELIGVGGDFAGNRPLISPELYREFIAPEVRAVSRRVHAGGARAINASDGNLWPVIDHFLLGCEVDGYIEIDLRAGMDLRKLKAGFGERIAFLGNLDCGNTLSFGTPDEVRAHTLDCIEAGLGGGGHVLTASNAITASVPIENYLAMINAYRDRFRIPPIDLP